MECEVSKKEKIRLLLKVSVMWRNSQSLRFRYECCTDHHDVVDLSPGMSEGWSAICWIGPDLLARDASSFRFTQLRDRPNTREMDLLSRIGP